MDRIVRLLGVLAVLAVAGCGASGSRAARTGRSPGPPAASSRTARTTGTGVATVARARSGRARAQSERERLARGLSVDQLAGQRVIYSYAGLQPPPALLRAIRRGEAGGVIFFGWNIANAPQIRAVIARMQRASLRSPLHDRLLMMTDQEGGEVRRLPGGPQLSEKQIGESGGGTALASLAGRTAARVLSAAGMNVNLAPVLDVYRRPGNFIDEYGRSYSGDPAVAGRLGAAFITAQQAGGVAATAKHFPGLGTATRGQNTDVRPVTLDVGRGRLRSVDEAPYRAAIAAGVKLVMVSWARYPALDRSRPAGLSRAVIQGELRARLGYRGVTITDAIGAGALAPFGPPARTAVMAARAGADLILCAGTGSGGNPPLQGLAVMHAIARAIADGALPRPAALASARRILRLRS